MAFSIPEKKNDGLNERSERAERKECKKKRKEQDGCGAPQQKNFDHMMVLCSRDVTIVTGILSLHYTHTVPPGFC